MFSRYILGRIISKGIRKYYGQFKMDLPALAKSIANGEMRFRDDRTMSGIHNDLDRFLKEVLNTQTLPPSLNL